MRFLLDTNVASESTKENPDKACDAWLEENRGQYGLSVITVAEMRYGVERLPEGKRKAELERDLRFLFELFSGQFLDFDGPAAVEWGRYAAELEAGHGSDWWKHFDLRDTQIAATAREYGLTIVTRNTRHFPYCETVNPFEHLKLKRSE